MELRFDIFALLLTAFVVWSAPRPDDESLGATGATGAGVVLGWIGFGGLALVAMGAVAVVVVGSLLVRGR